MLFWRLYPVYKLEVDELVRTKRFCFAVVSAVMCRHVRWMRCMYTGLTYFKKIDKPIPQTNPRNFPKKNCVEFFFFFFKPLKHPTPNISIERPSVKIHRLWEQSISGKSSDTMNCLCGQIRRDKQNIQLWTDEFNKLTTIWKARFFGHRFQSRNERPGNWTWYTSLWCTWSVLDLISCTWLPIDTPSL